MSIATKIQYTYEAIEDIKAALISKGIDLTGVTLKEFGDIIRNLQNVGAGGLEISFLDYTRTTNNYYSTRSIGQSLNITTETAFTFTDNIAQIEEEI